MSEELLNKIDATSEHVFLHEEFTAVVERHVRQGVPTIKIVAVMADLIGQIAAGCIDHISEEVNATIERNILAGNDKMFRNLELAAAIPQGYG